MEKEHWTSNAPPSCEISLTVEFLPTKYGFPPNEYIIVSRPPKIKKTRRKWKKKVLGVTY
jgi:hypothetical protein